MTDFADGAVPVIGGELDQQGDAARTVALPPPLFVGRAGQFAGTTLDGAFDVVAGHIGGFGVEDGLAQTRVFIRIATPDTGGHDDFANNTGEDLAALSVERALLVLDCGPF